MNIFRIHALALAFVALLATVLMAHSADSSPAGYKNLTVDQFAQMTTTNGIVLLDVRTSAEFESGHIHGAQNLDVSAADFAKKAGALDKARTCLVYCASGVRSVKACETLAGLGFTKLYNLTGGIRAWTKAEKPVEK